MSLCEWYVGRSVLLTGATSELGRALLEKILRSLPDVKVYIILRSQDGLTKEDRLKKIFSSPGYERLIQETPNAILRVQALEGNLLHEGLGLSAKDKALLSEVTVTFHAGGPHEFVLEYCQELPRLKSIAMASSIFKHRGKIIEYLQNETIPKMPVAVVRFPFIGPAYKEPMPGLVETLKGPTALMVGAGFALGDSSLDAEIIPRDTAVNTMIAAAWELSISNAAEPVVYNAVTIGYTWQDLIKKSRWASWKFPYPTFGVSGMTSSSLLYWILVLLFEWLPSVLCDSIFALCGRKQRIVVEHNRVRNALQSLELISSRPWMAERKRVYSLQDRFTLEDQETFPVNGEIDIDAYVLCVAASAQKYCAQKDNFKIITIIRTVLLLVPVIPIVTYFVLFTNRANKVT